MPNFAIVYTHGWHGQTSDALGLKAVLERHGHQVELVPVWSEELPDLQLGPERIKGTIVINAVRGVVIPRSPSYRLLMWSPHWDDFMHPAAQHWDGVITNSRRVFQERLGDLPLLLRPLPVDVEFYHPVEPQAEMRCEVLYIGGTHKSLAALDLYLGPAARFDLHLYGYGWSEGKYMYGPGSPVHPELARTHAECYGRFHRGFLDPEAMSAAYSSCAIALSFHVPQQLVADQPSNRLLQAMACGCFVIEDRMPWHMEEFWDCVAFTRGGQETERLIEYYLTHLEERAAIAARGRERIIDLGYDTDAFVRDLEVFASELRTRGLTRAGTW